MGLAMRRHGVQVRQGSVVQVLEWAFAVERAQLEFDELGAPAGVDTIWMLMQRGMLGCEIDGGGCSAPASDADIVASVVAALPEACGGRGMALRIAELARAGRAPDWMGDVRPRLVPRAWRQTRHGWFGVTEASGFDDVRHRGRVVRHERRCCPVVWSPTAGQIAAARRAYLDWWGALLHIRSALSAVGLERWQVTGAMPPMTPWRERA